MTEPTWWESFKELLDSRFDNLDQRFDHTNKALELQAREYERRLSDLNHAHEEALRVQHTFVSIDKYEDKMKSEEEARKIALDRLDEKISAMNTRFEEKLDDYIKRYELRQREIDQALAIGKGAADEAERIAHEQSQKAKELSEHQARRTNRNMALVTIALTIIIAISNWIGS